MHSFHCWDCALPVVVYLPPISMKGGRELSTCTQSGSEYMLNVFQIWFSALYRAFTTTTDKTRFRCEQSRNPASITFLESFHCDEQEQMRLKLETKVLRNVSKIRTSVRFLKRAADACPSGSRYFGVLHYMILKPIFLFLMMSEDKYMHCSCRLPPLSQSWNKQGPLTTLQNLFSLPTGEIVLQTSYRLHCQNNL